MGPLGPASKHSVLQYLVSTLTLVQRRIHYVAQHGAPKPDGSDPNIQYAGPVDVFAPEHHDDFRARFHRSIVAPPPFRNFPPEAHQRVPGPPPAASGSGTPGEPINPHLTFISSTDDRDKAGIDPSLSQARTEAAGVAGKLERF